MTNKISTTKQGFTIIEVVLVLAIAGLIFLMVFVAFPALQRNQRDTQRRTDAGRMVTAVTSYIADHNSAPADNKFVSTYLSEGFEDPGGGDYTVTVTPLESGNGTNPTAVGNVTLFTSAYCSAGDTATYKSGSRYFAVVTKLESGVYCQDNS